MSEERAEYVTAADSGPMAVEYRLRSAVARLVEVLLPAVPAGGGALPYSAIAAGVALRGAAGGTLADLVRAVGRSRPLLGEVPSWNGVPDVGGAWSLVLMAYDAALVLLEKSGPLAAGVADYAVRHTATGKALSARFNARAGEGLLHMTWVDPQWADRRPLAECEKVLAAYEALSGDLRTEIVRADVLKGGAVK